MKKFIAIILALITATLVGTTLFFGYRYMWFAIETIPEGRLIMAIVGSIIIGFFTAMFWIEGEPFK